MWNFSPGTYLHSSVFARLSGKDHSIEFNKNTTSVKSVHFCQKLWLFHFENQCSSSPQKLEAWEGGCKKQCKSLNGLLTTNLDRTLFYVMRRWEHNYVICLYWLISCSFPHLLRKVPKLLNLLVFDYHFLHHRNAAEICVSV